MKIEDAVEYVSSKFVYEKDPRVLGDTWHVLSLKNDKFKGDCDDFLLTCLWYYSDKKLFKFLFNLLITHKYKIYRCKTITDEWHVVGVVDGLWFDNWSRKALSKEEFFKLTEHTIKMRYYSPMFAFYLLVGLVK